VCLNFAPNAFYSNNKLIGVFFMSFRLLAILLTSLMAVPAVAQTAKWQWRDTNGRMVYSDTPPPPSVPPKAIVRGPNGRDGGLLRPVAEAPEMPQGITAGGKKQPAGQTPEEALQKRLEAKKNEQELQAKVEAEKKERAALCSRSKNYLAALQRNTRVGVPAEDGSVRTIDADERKSEIARTQDSIVKNCTTGA
jgi:hypothetical protein